MCVVARKGDPIAGQIWVEVDHLDGTASLFAPAPATAGTTERLADRLFEQRLDHVDPQKIRERLNREADFDPDFWHISLESRAAEHGLELVE